ncbi:putative RNA-directed DNA polymerase from transposon BS [Amphibalanus amphitrite]|uniref:Putative RNA-directed DNA polymerase from transposon BS n=1 Tax=Amphibalanus amphitrite TaxID=1232801 RepID=A0A6A4WGN0_AMPAM|nr:putative RNA-directed DNA polymerase from transposon BS [Amphibalanus amphitrite]
MQTLKNSHWAATRVDSQTAPDIAVCALSLARRTSWLLDDSLGSDHRVMKMTVRSGFSSSRRVRKARWAFKKADWSAWSSECEAALADPPRGATAQQLCTRFTAALQKASARHIPRGARADPKPWAADPELEEAIADRRSAQARVDPAVPETIQHYVETRRRAAEVEARVSRQRFHQMVSEELNKPNSIGRVSKILKRWEGATDDDHRDGQAMEHGGRLLVKDGDKADAFCQTYAWVSRQVRVPKVDRLAKQQRKALTPSTCRECDGARVGCCGAFSMDELVRQLNSLKLKKTPGPDGITAEMLLHLGPTARRELLHAINSSWQEGAVPREWRQATICPIPKAGKDKRLISSYRPIALTSHVSKLVERLVLSRLNHVVAARNLIPPEQVGFREGRSVEDSLGRLVQQVQDGWQRPRSRKKQPADGETAQRYVLTAFDFSRAYDTVDHRLLPVRLLQQGIPLCLITWIWSFLRDRRAHTEVNGTKSRERIFRAGLPQGTVLAPTLFLLWAAPLADALKKIPGTTPYMYADDTATLCSGNTILVARRRAQQAADVLVQWAIASKMRVASEKTQVLVLSQAPKDAVDCYIKVAGETVAAGAQLKLLGVTLDRTLHFGAHCRNLRQKTRPRIAQLKRLTGRDWGLREQQLRAVANGYVRGPQEHAAAAWLPATPASHVEILEREVRAAARVITGCPVSTRTHALLAEAGMPPVSARRLSLAARFLAKARALPREDPLRTVADEVVPARLSSVTGWRQVGTEVWEAAGVSSPIEPILASRQPPWVTTNGVTFRLDVGPGLPPRAASAQTKLEVATLHLSGLPQCATLDAVETHQLRAGHWSGSAQYLHRIGRHPSPECAQCSDRGCRAGWCRACGEEADTPDHVLLRCPALMNARLRIFGTIFPSLSDVRRDDAVAALARVARYLQSR